MTEQVDLVPLAIIIEQKTANTQRYHKREIERAAFAGTLLSELAAYMPHTLARYFTLDQIGTGWGYPVEESHYSLNFKTIDGLPADEAPTAFGTIIKVAGAMMGAGYRVDPTPEIKATQFAHALDVEVKGERGRTKVSIVFSHLPESERCKLVEEQVYVPAKYETKLRVECEGQPVQLTSADTEARLLEEAQS